MGLVLLPARARRFGFAAIALFAALSCRRTAPVVPVVRFAPCSQGCAPQGDHCVPTTAVDVAAVSPSPRGRAPSSKTILAIEEPTFDTGSLWDVPAGTPPGVIVRYCTDDELIAVRPASEGEFPLTRVAAQEQLIEMARSPSSFVRRCIGREKNGFVPLPSGEYVVIIGLLSPVPDAGTCADSRGNAFASRVRVEQKSTIVMVDGYAFGVASAPPGSSSKPASSSMPAASSSSSAASAPPPLVPLTLSLELRAEGAKAGETRLVLVGPSVLEEVATVSKRFACIATEASASLVVRCDPSADPLVTLDIARERVTWGSRVISLPGKAPHVAPGLIAPVIPACLGGAATIIDVLPETQPMGADKNAPLRLRIPVAGHTVTISSIGTRVDSRSFPRAHRMDLYCWGVTRGWTVRVQQQDGLLRISTAYDEGNKKPLVFEEAGAIALPCLGAARFGKLHYDAWKTASACESKRRSCLDDCYEKWSDENAELSDADGQKCEKACEAKFAVCKP